MLNVESARRQMIEQQVRTWEVLDPRVLDALSHVAREHFVPEAYRALAFADIEIPLPHGQSMLPPKLEGRILQSVAPQADDRVLEIGTGSGFFAACLARLAARVRTVEIVPELAGTASMRLRAANAYNVAVATADGMTLDDPDGYDVIVLSGSMPLYDARFEQRLTEGGRLFAIVGQGPMMDAMRITRVGPNEWLRESLFETVAPPLVHAPAPPRFVF